jgi:hypothetical protein
MTTTTHQGPRCDYQDCPRHTETIERIGSPKRHHYCSVDCRNDEIKRKLRIHDAGRTARA